MVCRNRRGHHGVPLLLLVPVFLLLAGFFSCSLPVQTFGAKKADLTLKFLVFGEQGASRSIDSRILLPTAKMITVTLEPLGSNLSPQQTITNPLMSNMVAARFAGILYGTYLVKAEANDATGQALFRQSAEIQVGASSTQFLLNMLPVVFDEGSLTAVSGSQVVTKVLGADASETWKIPSEAVIAGKYRFNANIDSSSLLQVFVQSMDGKLLNRDRETVFSQEIDVGIAAASYLTLYNPGANPLSVRFLVNGLTLSYDANGASGGTVPVDLYGYVEGDRADVKGNPGLLVKVGHTFTGWNTQANGNGVSYLSASKYTMGASAVTLYAQWAVNSNTVSFHSNGGTGTMGTQTIASDATDYLTPNTFTRSGYTFAGWSTTSGIATVVHADGGSYTMGTADVTLYAQWTANPNTVIFHSNGGTGTMVPQTIATNASAALSLNLFSRSGYVFVGWATSAGGPASYTDGGIFMMGASDVTLYAQWKKYTIMEYSGVGVWNTTFDAPLLTKALVKTDGTFYALVEGQIKMTFDGVWVSSGLPAPPSGTVSFTNVQGTWYAATPSQLYILNGSWQSLATTPSGVNSLSLAGLSALPILLGSDGIIRQWNGVWTTLNTAPSGTTSIGSDQAGTKLYALSGTSLKRWEGVWTNPGISALPQGSIGITSYESTIYALVAH